MDYDFSTKKLVKGSGVVFIGSILQLSLKFISGIIIARILGPAQYGILSLARNVVLILTLFSRGGFELAIVKAIHQKKNKNYEILLLQIIFFIITISFTYISVIHFWGAHFLNNYYFRHEYFEDALKILIWSLPAISLVQVLRGVFRAYLHFLPVVLTEKILQPGFRLILFLFFFVFCDWRLKGVLYATVISFYLAAFYLLFLIFKNFLNFTFLKLILSDLFCLKDFWTTFKFSGITFLTGSVILLLNRMDILMIGYFLSSDKIGNYTIIQIIVPVITLIGSSLNQVIAPLITNAWVTNDVVRLEKIMLQHIKYTLLATLPLMWPFLSFGDKLINFICPNYTVNILVVCIITLTNFFLYTFFVTGYVLSMTNRYVAEFFCMSSALLFNFVFNVLLIPRYGLVGAAIATFIGIWVSLVLKMIAIYKFFKIHIFQKEIFQLFTLCLICLCLGIIIRLFVLQYIVFSEIITIGVGFILFIFIYFFILIHSPFKKDIYNLFTILKERKRTLKNKR